MKDAPLSCGKYMHYQPLQQLQSARRQRDSNRHSTISRTFAGYMWRTQSTQRTKQARFSIRMCSDYDKHRRATQFYCRTNMTDFVANMETLLTLHQILQQVYKVSSSHTTTKERGIIITDIKSIRAHKQCASLIRILKHAKSSKLQIFRNDSNKLTLFSQRSSEYIKMGESFVFLYAAQRRTN